MRRWIVPLVLLAALTTPIPAADSSQWGRDLENRPTVSLNLSAGSLFELDGSVKETTRPIYEVLGGGNEGAEDYSFDELGFTESYPVFGLEFEKMWKYVTLQLRGAYVAADAQAEAERDYYLGVEEVSFGGEDYDYMKIPQGQDYEADIQGGMLGARALVTPFTLEPESWMIEFVPSVYFGVFSFAGYYEIDAGPAEGVILYENPPREYVVGGTGKGWTGIAVPEIGLGGELRLGQGQRFGRDVSLILEGYYSIFQFEGTTEDLGISSRHDKLLDLDYTAYEVRLLFEIPMSESLDLFFGAGYQVIEADALSRAEDRPAEEVLALREKFDKDIHFEMSQATALLGIRY